MHERIEIDECPPQKFREAWKFHFPDLDLPGDLRLRQSQAAQRAEYEVFWYNGKLTIRNPGDARVFSPLKPSGEEGSWISEVSGNRISFNTDDQGRVIALVLDAASTFRRR